MKKIIPLLLVALVISVEAHSQGDTTIIENLVLEGAGIRGIAYCGALMELEERHLLDHVQHVAGTSSGAITACFYSVGYSPTEIFDVIGETDFSKFNDGHLGAMGGMYRLRKRLGWYPGREFMTWLEEKIEIKTGNREITFSQLKKLSASPQYKQLVIAATSLNHQCSVYFSAETYPDMRIVDAVRASMAVPFYFEPVIIDSVGKLVSAEQMTREHHLCVDGGFTANFIIAYFDGDTPAKTLGLRIDKDEQIANDQEGRELAYQDVHTATDFMKAFYYITKETMNRMELTEADWQRTVSISDCDIGPKVEKLSPAQKQKLINAGRLGVRVYYEKTSKPAGME